LTSVGVRGPSGSRCSSLIGSAMGAVVVDISSQGLLCASFVFIV
jgi:hypothetical protein